MVALVDAGASRVLVWKMANRNLPLQLEMLGIAEELSAGMLLKEAAAFLTPARRLFGLHHIHLSDPLTARLGRKGGAGRDRKEKNGHKGGRKKGPWVLQSTTEGERVEGWRWGGSARLICASFLRDEPGVNEGVKYSAEGLKRRILSDVKQLQRWDANPGTEPLLKNAIPPPALIFIWSCGTLTFLRTSCRNRPPLMFPWCKFCLTAWWLVTFRPPFTHFQISSRSWLPSVPRHSFKC